MGATALDFSRLQTPSASGEVLVEPAPPVMRALLDSAAGLIQSWNVRIADLDLQAVRRAVRQRVAGIGDDRPVIVTGHQPEFIHPGVWAKHVVVARLAQASGGSAVNLIVDTDAPKQTVLRVPTFRGGRLREGLIRYADIPSGVPYEHIIRLDAEATVRLETAARQLLGERFERSMLGVYFAAFAGADDAEDFADQSVAGRSAVERCFGISLLERRVSRSWCCPLLVEMFRRTSRFFECYNSALADYRRAQGIRGTRRPIPDLLREADRLELPIWVMHGDAPRRRLFVEIQAERLHLFADRRPVGVIPVEALKRWESARQHLDALEGVAFRPRALPLMLWARMLLADLFVHGIGGAKYDRITDLLIERYFGVAPPPMACVSATLRLDLPRSGVSVELRRELQHAWRDLHYNPQRHLPMEEAIAGLADARARAVERSRRLHNEHVRDRARRRAVFHEIRSLNRRMVEARPQIRQALQERIRRVQQELKEDQVAAGREYFFALFDRGSLERLCDALPAVEEFRIQCAGQHCGGDSGRRRPGHGS